MKKVLYRHELRLIAVAPLPHIDEDSEEQDDTAAAPEESASFNANAHNNFIVQTLKVYGIDAEKWVVCHAADNAAVNIKIVKDTHGRHISCICHLGGLGGKEMMNDDPELADTIETIKACNNHVANSCVVSTSLRNVAAAANPQHASISPKTGSATRQWMGNAAMLAHALKLKPYYAELVEQDVGQMRKHKEVVDPDFVSKCEEQLKPLVPICAVIVQLQQPRMRLCDSQGLPDHLIKQIEDNRDTPGELFHGCKFGVDKMKVDNGLNTKPEFNTGVMKIQNGIATEQTM